MTSFIQKQLFVFTSMISWTAASARRLSLQARITLAPLLARSIAVVLPMPVFAPGEEGQNHTKPRETHFSTDGNLGPSVPYLNDCWMDSHDDIHDAR